MGARYHIRDALPADAAALVAIERRAFSDPWSEEGFREMLGIEGVLGLVAEGPDGVQGYAIAREVAGEGEILNLAVVPEHRGQGIAGVLLGAMLEGLATREVSEAFLEVRESNLIALALYHAHGFRVVGRRVAYYRQPREDALVLRRPFARSE
jgi:ribosomal-protein-alanine N-acetyltransferase